MYWGDQLKKRPVFACHGNKDDALGPFPKHSGARSIIKENAAETSLTPTEHRELRTNEEICTQAQGHKLYILDLVSAAVVFACTQLKGQFWSSAVSKL